MVLQIGMVVDQILGLAYRFDHTYNAVSEHTAFIVPSEYVLAFRMVVFFIVGCFLGFMLSLLIVVHTIGEDLEFFHFWLLVV